MRPSAPPAKRLRPSDPPAHRLYPSARPTNRLLAHAPNCSRCRKPMKVRILLPGRRFDDVSYRCEDCGEEVMRPVPRAG